jgi:hypothetical protein
LALPVTNSLITFTASTAFSRRRQSRRRGLHHLPAGAELSHIESLAIAKTMTLFEIKKAQKQIFDHVSSAASLSDAASVLVKFVYHLSPDCYFNPVKTVASEWVLRPKNWVGFYFSAGRSGYDPKIIVSLDVWPENLKSEGDSLKIRQGRKPQWSKFTLNNIGQMSDALRLIATAQRYSGA